MNNIPELLDTLTGNKAAIKAAIIAKQPTIPPTGVMSNWAASIGSIPADSENTTARAVFRDYDGTILYQFLKDEVASMSALPALPTHSGLTCQGWNWTLQQVKDYVASYGRCEVGAIYTTDDGKSRIKLTIQNQKYVTVPIAFRQTVANGVQVDWGDGSAVQTYSGTSQQTVNHTYSPAQYPATYTVTFKVNNGTMAFGSYIMGKGGTQSASNPVYAWNSMIDEAYIGNNVTSIAQAFTDCPSLTFITIPNSITEIGENTFKDCHSLVSVNIPNSVTRITNNLFQKCYSLTSVSIPSSITDISGRAFYACYGLAQITIPNSVTTINYGAIAGYGAFTGCRSLTSIVIPSSVTAIGVEAFEACSSLNKVIISNGVTSIGNNAFSDCYSLRYIAIPNSVTSIGQSAFLNCYNLTNVILPNNITRIHDYTFKSCYSLVSVNIPNSVTYINSQAFQYCYSLTSLTIPNSVTYISSQAFQYCYSLTSLTIPNSVVSAYPSIFQDCWSLKVISMSANTNAIHESMFENCYSITAIVIPSSVTTIYIRAFYNCYGLKLFDFRTATAIPSLNNVNAFQNTPTDREIIVPDELYDDWIAASNWSSTTNNIVGSIVKASQSSLGPLS